VEHNGNSNRRLGRQARDPNHLSTIVERSEAEKLFESQKSFEVSTIMETSDLWTIVQRCGNPLALNRPRPLPTPSLVIEQIATADLKGLLTVELLSTSHLSTIVER
jgi:hypothetical protein